MLSRRIFTVSLIAGLAAPYVSRASAQAFDDIRTSAREMDQLHSIQIQLGDEPVLEEAFRGPGLDRPANIKSCSKSVVALLLGTAIDSGEIAGVEARLGDVAPDIIPSDATAGVADITMEDLVTLRAGLEGTSGPNYGAWVNSSDWLAYALRRPMIAQPGTRMIYSTGTTHILGAALTAASGESLLALARDRLGSKLGFQVPPWTRDPQGYYLGGNEMALTPRAMLAIARLIRDNGRSDGAQVIPADWVDASLVRRTRSPFSGLGYGYGWFLSESGYVVARGYGGQLIAAHPERRLAIAITSDPTRPAYSRGYFGDLMQLLEGPVLSVSRES
ncbi:serine hydrolase domain-containing protein [Chelativorans sp. YIM 93263]|uniref:serine hydrolase domain-containing protein n=1 Tax=Chelativorans sp. YIM 93263 TaxID=2906648 RepID=UPI002377F3AA|nr:serine hydrolase [Chelativorans sp. YIM 93263]